MTVQEVITEVQAITGDGGSRWNATTVLVPFARHVEGLILKHKTRAWKDSAGNIQSRQTISGTGSTLTVSSDWKEEMVEGMLWLCYRRESGDAEDRARAKAAQAVFFSMLGIGVPRGR